MKTKVLSIIAMLSLSAAAVADNANKTPGDLTDPQLQQMSDLVMAYNRCMMQGRLENSREGQVVQENANKIMQACESDLDAFGAFLTEHNINEQLAAGMQKRMRSRAARQLMTNRMNNLAEQAQAAENAQKSQQ